MAISEERKIKLESMQIKGIRCLIRENIDGESLGQYRTENKCQIPQSVI